MDITTLAAARAYTDKQRLGYTEPAKVLTFSLADAPEDTVIFGEHAKVTDEVMDLTLVKKVKINAVEEVVVLTEFTVETLTESGLTMTLLVAGEDVPVVCIHETVGVVQKGTYLIIAPEIRVEFAEVVHKIDEKYLPSGGGLPVVELTTVAMEQPTPLTEEETAKVNALNGQPFILRGTVGGITLTGVPVHTYAEGMINGYTLGLGEFAISLMCNEGAWIVVGSTTVE